MIVFVESGRLGNQLFQYAALNTLALEQRERLLLLGFGELASVFDGVNATIVAPPRIALRAIMRHRERLDAVCTGITQLGLVGSVPTDGKRAAHVRLPGAAGLSYATRAWFDSGDAFSAAAIASLVVKPELRQWAQAVLARHGDAKRPAVFVHVRRGDYLHWPSTEHPAVLPLSWYVGAMELMRARYDTPRFVFVTDDVPYVHEHFGQRTDCFIAGGTPAQDFAMMSVCTGGILSASSFSWWGALFSARQSSSAWFLGPKHWDWHRRGTGLEPVSPHHAIEFIAVPEESPPGMPTAGIRGERTSR